jgi:hypothetical protein
MIDSISRSKDIGCSNVGRRVVGDYLSKGSPSAQELLEDEIGDNVGGIGRRSSAFCIGSHGTASMQDVTIGSNFRHQESVKVCLSK